MDIERTPPDPASAGPVAPSASALLPILPATRAARWRRTLGLAVRAPILAVLYMLFLPLVGFAVLAWAIARKVDDYLHADVPRR